MEHGYIIKHDEFCYEIHTDILINATAEQVWAVLTDFATMAEWSPNFQGIEGKFADGETIISLYQDAQYGLVKARHRITVVDGVKFSWSDEFNVLQGMRDNHHYIVNQAGEGQCRFIQRDTHSGKSQITNEAGETVLFTPQMLTATQLEPFMAFNRALKQEAERRYPR